jgi:hypothetical protein
MSKQITSKGTFQYSKDLISLLKSRCVLSKIIVLLPSIASFCCSRIPCTLDPLGQGGIERFRFI